MKRLRLKVITDIYKYLTSQERKKVWFIALLSGINALCETYSIFVVYMFIRIVQDDQLIYKYDYFNWLNASKVQNSALYFGLVVIVFYIAKATINYLNLKTMSVFAEQTFARLSKASFFKYLNMPYIKFVQLSPSKVNDIIRRSHIDFSDSLILIIGVITEVFTLLFLTIMLIIVNWKLLVIIVAFLSTVSLIILKITGKKNRELSSKLFKQESYNIKVVYNSLFNYKLLKLTGMNKTFTDEFNLNISKEAKIKTSRTLLGALPKLSLESICFIGLVIGIMCGVYLTRDPEFVIAQATLCLFVLLKITPSLMKSFYAIQSLTFKNHTINRIPLSTDDVVVENLGDESITFRHKITVDKIGFKYDDQHTIFNNISFEINKGERVGLIGASGVGKSTLQDIIIGLLHQTSGSILVDGAKVTEKNLKSWRKHIGYIPQEIHLYNGTIAENVVLNRVYNEEMLINALKKAHIYEFLLTKEGINTQVGNNGVMLSGGQKQRIGIARALYENPDILVFDEATSALDEETERKIMDEIYLESQGQTLIIITHRISTLSGCDKIYRLDKYGIHLT